MLSCFFTESSLKAIHARIFDSVVITIGHLGIFSFRIDYANTTVTVSICDVMSFDMPCHDMTCLDLHYKKTYSIKVLINWANIYN